MKEQKKNLCLSCCSHCTATLGHARRLCSQSVSQPMCVYPLILSLFWLVDRFLGLGFYFYPTSVKSIKCNQNRRGRRKKHSEGKKRAIYISLKLLSFTYRIGARRMRRKNQQTLCSCDCQAKRNNFSHWFVSVKARRNRESVVTLAEQWDFLIGKHWGTNAINKATVLFRSRNYQ